MTPPGFTPGASSTYGYRITQPAVILRYFRTFFVPTGLTADTDRALFTTMLQDDAIAGFLFVLILLCFAVWTTRAADCLDRSSNLKPTPEAYLKTSLAFYHGGDFTGCIEAARKALDLRPGYAAAWNNIGAAYNSMHNWDEGILAAQEAVRLDPNFQLAKSNLAWAQQQKAAQH